ncbi:MAG: WYL domain-containing protein [Micrococcales bacterium]|nr:WYL domain-containing protein [Micrococcales bacterium]
MNRTDRLYALREELRRAGPSGRTAARLAADLEVSVRTVKRDVSALQQGGFPVWARPGPTGGYVVDASATLPPVNITAAEASALAAALAAHHGQPFARHGAAALTKIMAVMDEPTRARTLQLCGRVWVDDGEQPGPSGVLGPVEQALAERRVLALEYRDAQGNVTSRRADPQLLACRAGCWFIVAHCRLRGQVRWFRLDRIERAALTAETATDIPVDDLGEPPPTARPVAPRP